MRCNTFTSHSCILCVCVCVRVLLFVHLSFVVFEEGVAARQEKAKKAKKDVSIERGLTAPRFAVTCFPARVTASLAAWRRFASAETCDDARILSQSSAASSLDVTAHQKAVRRRTERGEQRERGRREGRREGGPHKEQMSNRIGQWEAKGRERREKRAGSERRTRIPAHTNTHTHNHQQPSTTINNHTQPSKRREVKKLCCVVLLCVVLCVVVCVALCCFVACGLPSCSGPKASASRSFRSMSSAVSWTSRDAISASSPRRMLSASSSSIDSLAGKLGSTTHSNSRPLDPAAAAAAVGGGDDGDGDGDGDGDDAAVVVVVAVAVPHI